MKLIQITTKRMKNFSADLAYILNLAENFNDELGSDYQLVVAEQGDEKNEKVNILSLGIKPFFKNLNLIFYYTYLRYFFWFPIFYGGQKDKKDIIFFSNEVNLSLMLIFWRTVLGARYKICTDWHMLFKNKREKAVIRNSDFLITTSEKLKKQIIELSGIDENIIKTVYGGVDLSLFKRQEKTGMRNKLNLPRDKKLVAYVGLFKTMKMDKGLEVMIKSLKFLSDDVMMVFVGARNNEVEEYGKLAEENDVKERCLILEKKPSEEVAQFEQAVDILVIPYPDKPHFRDYGFPMKVYEYMATENPIVYSALELSEEVLDDCGFKFKPDDPKDLAEKISFIFSDNEHEEIVEKSSRAKKKVKNLDWKSKTKEIIKFINK